jgi:hypothetical protein
VERGAVSVARTSNGLGCRGPWMTCVDGARACGRSCEWRAVAESWMAGNKEQRERAERKRREEKRQVNLARSAGSTLVYEGLPACPPATASTHSTPAITPDHCPAARPASFLVASSCTRATVHRQSWGHDAQGLGPRCISWRIRWRQWGLLSSPGWSWAARMVKLLLAKA